MIKKIVCSLAICLFGLMAFGNTFAIASTFYAEMADGINGNVKTEFGWNETPWLHLHLSPVEAWTVSGSFWNSPSDEYFLTKTDSVVKDIWVSLDSGEDSAGNSVSWNSVREMGEWDIDGAYAIAGVEQGTYSLDFTVTPEPVSSILFLVGGVSLAAVRLRRRKK